MDDEPCIQAEVVGLGDDDYIRWEIVAQHRNRYNGPVDLIDRMPNGGVGGRIEPRENWKTYSGIANMRAAMEVIDSLTM